MKDTENVKLLSVFEWAKIIEDKFGEDIAISFIRQANPIVIDSKSFAPSCYFDMRNAKEPIEFWKEVSKYAQDVVWNTTENIYKEVIHPTLEEIEKELNPTPNKIKKELTKEEQEWEDKLQALIDSSYWQQAISELAEEAWTSVKKIIKLIKKDFRKSPESTQSKIDELTELLKKIK